jgi:hypothetical protein
LMCCKHWNQVMPVVSHIRIFLHVERDAFPGKSGSSVFCWSVAVGRNGKGERELHGLGRMARTRVRLCFGCRLFGIRARCTAILHATPLWRRLARYRVVDGEAVLQRTCSSRVQQDVVFTTPNFLASRQGPALMTADRANKAVV